MKSKEQIHRKSNDLLAETNWFPAKIPNSTQWISIVRAMEKLADWLQSAESETDERIKRMSDKVDAAIKEDLTECERHPCIELHSCSCTCKNGFCLFKQP